MGILKILSEEAKKKLVWEVLTKYKHGALITVVNETGHTLDQDVIDDSAEDKINEYLNHMGYPWDAKYEVREGYYPAYCSSAKDKLDAFTVIY